MNELDKDLAIVDATVVRLRASVKRTAPNPLDEAKRMRFLAANGMSQAEIARQLGTTEGLVSQRLALLRLAPAIQKMLDDSEMTFAAARACCRLTMDEQMQLIDKGETITTEVVDVCLSARSSQSMPNLSAIRAPSVEPPVMLLSQSQVEAALQGQDIQVEYQGRTVQLRLSYDDASNSQESQP